MFSRCVISLLVMLRLVIKAEHILIKIPPNISIGVATSAFQIEGGSREDGRNPSIWDSFIEKFPEKIEDQSNANVASDSYHKFDDDLQALINLEVDHYRFSISWSRIMKTYDVNATVNQKGVDYYNYMIDKLIENKINPMVTMLHYDMPDELMKSGGMTDPKFIKSFETYAENLFRLFGDRVKMWITFNEPICYCIDSYGRKMFAPAVGDSGVSEYLCIHNLLKAHGMVYRLYKIDFYETQRGKIGITLGPQFYFSKDNDSDSVYRVLQYDLGLLAHPIFSKKGGYPEILVEEIAKSSKEENRTQSRLPYLSNYWKSIIKGSADFLGLNYYTSRFIEKEDPSKFPNPSYDRDIGMKLTVDPSWKKAHSCWLYSVPSGLEYLLKFIRDEYDNVEVIITENGWSDGGEVEDHDRVEYIKSHIEAMLNAINDGCNVTGYTAWSLMDNFEWIGGYSDRLGLHYIDFNSEAKQRIPKLSAKFFTKLITERVIPKNL